MRERWLIDSGNRWVWRFHRDETSWLRDPKVFIDRGRAMPDGPPLLKERRSLRKSDAEEIWKSLLEIDGRRLCPPRAPLQTPECDTFSLYNRDLEKGRKRGKDPVLD